jgi:hypothetical protein
MFRIAAVALWSTAAHAGGPVTLLETQDTPTATIVFESKADGVKIGLVQNTEASQSAVGTLVSKNYDALCEAPCSFALEAGWHEFYFSHKKREWSKKLEVEPGPQTLTVRPMTPAGLAGIGITNYSGWLLFPIGLPLWVGGRTLHKITPLAAPPAPPMSVATTVDS